MDEQDDGHETEPAADEPEQETFEAWDEMDEDELMWAIEEEMRQEGRRRPTEDEIDECNQQMLDRQRDFRRAAEYVAGVLGRASSVEKVVLFGSVAVPLRKEIPRFRRFRRHRIEVWHECKDVDLAVWVTDLGELGSLRKETARAVNRLYDETGIGVADHQVDLFVMEPGSDRQLGFLCNYGTCPKDDKMECRVPGCGEPPFLRRNPDFEFDREALAADATVLLYGE